MRWIGTGSNRHDRESATVTLIMSAVAIIVTVPLVYTQVIVVHVAWPTLTTAVRETLGYLLCFELYFYALHRLLHVRSVYRRIHIVHHRSVSPNALGGLVLHPVEALLIMSFVPIAMWTMPIHLPSLAVVSVFLSGSILLAHSDVGWFPDWWERVPVLNWYVTPRVHARHHAHGVSNYGSTLSICDRMFGTFAAPEASRPHGARDGVDHLGHGRLARRPADAQDRLMIAPEQDQRRSPALDP